jgi:ABC-2 type transport system ATP-binding protein
MSNSGYDWDAPLCVEGLTRRFKRTVALDNVSLSVPKGVVFGLVGSNGAGKTTLIKHALGLMKAESGTVRVFGKDPVAVPEEALATIGYLSEDRDIPGWMRVGELMKYTRAFFPNWDPAFAEELRAHFGLDKDARIRTLSRGQKAMAGLLAAMAHRPPLLLLDEPSSGLDPVARRDILGGIIRTVADENRTVLFSSHLLDEVERVADHIAMIHEGHVVLSGPMEDIRAAHHRLTIHYQEAPTQAPTLDGALYCDGAGREWTVICDGEVDTCRASAESAGARIVDTAQPTLEEIFLARVGRSHVTAGGLH